MSAFLVKDRTINQVVTWLHQQRSDSIYQHKIEQAFGLNLLDRADCGRLAQAMFELNSKAVRQRYRDADQSEMIPASFTPKYELATAMQAYKSLRCWYYQCAEGDIRETSILYGIMGEILDCLAHEIICSMPAYEKATWD